MNIFGVGGTELVIIVLIMLVVAGPKRMVRWAYFIGQYVGKFRKMWEEVVDVVQAEMDASGVDVKIPKELPTKQNIGKYVNELAKPYTKELEAAAKEIENPLKATLQEADKSLKETVAETDKSLKETTKNIDKAADETKAAKPVQKSNTTTPAFKFGQSKESKLPVTKPATAAANTNTNANGNLGAWSNPKPENTQSASSDNGGFGAWSNPQKPTGSQAEQEA